MDQVAAPADLDEAHALAADHAGILPHTFTSHGGAVGLLRARLEELRNRHQQLLAVAEALRSHRLERDAEARRRRLFDAIAAELERALGVGGELRQLARPAAPDGQVVVAVIPDEEGVHIEVEDTAVDSGEPELDLSMVSAIVERNHGKLEVRRTASGGIGVRIDLPRAGRVG